MRKLTLLTWIVALMFGVTAQGQAAHSGPQFAVPTRIRVSAAVMEGMLIKKGVPTYPEQALQTGISGDVISKVLISKEGRVLQAEIVKGDPLLCAASFEALREFRFRTYLLEGSPIEVETHMRFRFVLKGKPGKMKGTAEYESNLPWQPEFRTGFGEHALSLDAKRKAGPDPLSLPELAGKSGAVYVTVLVGVDGAVTDVKFVGGDQELANPVISAVKQFIYEPRLVNGRAVAFVTPESFHFGKTK